MDRSRHGKPLASSAASPTKSRGTRARPCPDCGHTAGTRCSRFRDGCDRRHRTGTRSVPAKTASDESCPPRRRTRAEQGNLRKSEYVQRILERLGGVDQHVVSQLECRLIEWSAGGSRSPRRKDRHFGIVDKYIARLCCQRRRGGQGSVALARIRASFAVEIESASGFVISRGKVRCDVPAIVAQREMPHARLVAEFA